MLPEGPRRHVRVRSLDDADFSGAVTRSSWALNTQTRTLRAEIDLPNPQAQFLPGMYAYAEVIVKRSDVMAVPLAAMAEEGNDNICFFLHDGKSVKTPVQTGGNDGKWIEVINKKVDAKWVPFDGEEDIIVGELSGLRDGKKCASNRKKATTRKKAAKPATANRNDNECKRARTSLQPAP